MLFCLMWFYVVVFEQTCEGEYPLKVGSMFILMYSYTSVHKWALTGQFGSMFSVQCRDAGVTAAQQPVRMKS